MNYIQVGEQFRRETEVSQEIQKNIADGEIGRALEIIANISDVFQRESYQTHYASVLAAKKNYSGAQRIISSMREGQARWNFEAYLNNKLSNSK